MFFDKVPEGQPDPVFGLSGAFEADTRSKKVNLLVGIYKNDRLQSESMPVVRIAREATASQDLVADYLPIDGHSEFLAHLGALVFGEKEWKGRDSSYAAQTAGGTAALRIGTELLIQEVTKTISIPTPTWPNHRLILDKAGCNVDAYPYYSREKKGVDFEAILKHLKGLPEKAAVILHACCHNPTGCDLSNQEWKELSSFMKKKRLFPFFDFAYQGFGDGLEKDAEAVRIFKEDGHDMLVAYSCSKNFSLYCQRVGALFALGQNAGEKFRIASQVKRIIRGLYSNPPAHGARIASFILGEEKLRHQWEKELEGMRARMTRMRKSLSSRLIAQAKKIDFRYLEKHKGMFSFLDMDKHQVQRMISEFGVYLLDSGRISVAGLSEDNIDYVVNSLLTVCEA